MPDPQTQPKYQIAKSQGGLLNVSAAQTAANGKGSASRGPPQRLKTIIRRLPPGLTQQEFETAIGDEWKAGQGKVSWALFRPGKVSKEYAIFTGLHEPGVDMD